MAGYVQFGDAEAAVCDILRADSNVVAVGSVTVSTDLVGFGVGDRWVRVTRTGGVPILWMQLDRPVIAVDAYAEDKATAYDLGCAARGAAFVASGTYTGHGLALFDVSDSQGLTWAPDEPSGAHYSFALTLITRPAP